MESFSLNSRLASGGFDFGTLRQCQVLLKNNAHYAWFILVPKVSEEFTEITQLNSEQYNDINSATLIVSQFVQQHFSPDKLNIGNIGNVVRQMHIHVVGRFETDPAWPGVVWSASEKQPYDPSKVDQIKEAFLKFLNS